MESLIESIQKQFKYYKYLGDEAMAQLNEVEMLSSLNNGELMNYHNSISVIVNHMSGNMKSRWTNVFTEDGEKHWRNRDLEFSLRLDSKSKIVGEWEEGWQCLFAVTDNLQESDFVRPVFIRNMEHTLIEALHRQMMHYAYHVGQIVFIAKEFRGNKWKSLSIPLGGSIQYNQQKFSSEKRKEHFTDEKLKDK